MSSKKGFTLIELLAVILILGIIALVAIPTISKTINTAKKSSFKTSVVNSFKTLDYVLYKKNTNTIPEEGIDISELNLKSNFTGGKFMLVDGKETAYYIRNKSFCAYGPIKDLRITDSCDSMDLTNPIVDDTKFIVTNNGNNIKVVLNEGLANDHDSGIDKYIINLYEGDKLVKTQEKKNIGETTFDNLKSACIYTVELVVYNGAGGTNISHKNIKTTITDVPSISVSDNDIWTASKTVTISYDNTKYNCEYSTDGALTWNTYSTPFTLTSNVTINARLIDKELSTNKGNASNKVVTKIDDIKPSVTLSKNSKTINISMSDNETGIIAYCVTKTQGSNNCSWTSITKINSTSKTYTATSAGTYYIYVKDEAGNISIEKSETYTTNDFCSYNIGQAWSYSYTGGQQSLTVPCDGTYKLEVWGAQGAYFNSSSNYGGRGGYSIGTININKNSLFYIYVGSQGSFNTSNTPFNGGGASNLTNTYSGSGGGGTDIRINSTSLYARVIVAGGGGAAGNGSSSYSATGGAGGGVYGSTGTSPSYTAGSLGSGAGPNYGGSISYWSSYQSYGQTAGSFGQGGSGGTSQSSFGGGGGWYGGGGATYAAASGGSGYVYTSSTASYYPSGCLLNSNYYLTSANTYAGNTSFTSIGGSTETGHSGNGYARITLMSFN